MSKFIRSFIRSFILSYTLSMIGVLIQRKMEERRQEIWLTTISLNEDIITL